MIDSGSRSQVRPLESFKRSRFGLLAIASFIIHYQDQKTTARNMQLRPSRNPNRIRICKHLPTSRY
jgi:hypothetical protein